uniref:G_PROTEIN_RECEP_F1_2 domain-containing protein n=1 Tax=Heterorhabditis bacteriophora TaxID=37862 RepID=A0A1I7WAV3_HETBA
MILKQVRTCQGNISSSGETRKVKTMTISRIYQYFPHVTYTFVNKLTVDPLSHVKQYKNLSWVVCCKHDSSNFSEGLGVKASGEFRLEADGGLRLFFRRQSSYPCFTDNEVHWLGRLINVYYYFCVAFIPFFIYFLFSCRRLYLLFRILGKSMLRIWKNGKLLSFPCCRLCLLNANTTGNWTRYSICIFAIGWFCLFDIIYFSVNLVMETIDLSARGALNHVLRSRQVFSYNLLISSYSVINYFIWRLCTLPVAIQDLFLTIVDDYFMSEEDNI